MKKLVQIYILEKILEDFYLIIIQGIFQTLNYLFLIIIYAETFLILKIVQ